MKSSLTIILIVLSFFSYSQTYKVTISDTIVDKVTDRFKSTVEHPHYYTIKRKYRKEGHYNIYQDSTFKILLSEIQFNDKQKDIKTSKYYYSSGELKLLIKQSDNECLYNMGNLYLYKKNGEILMSYILSNDTLTTTIYFANGNIKQIEKTTCSLSEYWYSGNPCNPTKEEYENKFIGIDYFYFARFCENGQMINEYNPNGYFQKIKEYDCDGILKRKYTLNGSFFCGEYIEYYKNGNVKTKGIMNSEFKIGKWQYWNEKGELIKEENYDDEGVLLETKKY